MIIKSDQRKGEEIVRSAEAHSSQCWRLALAPDYTFIASVSDAIVKLWNVDTLELMQSLIGHGDEETVNCVDVAPDSTMVVTGDSSGVVKLWEKGGVESWACTKTLEDQKEVSGRSER